MAAILASSTQTPVGLSSARCVDAEFGQSRDDDPLQSADVVKRAQSGSPQVEYRVADELSGSVVGHLSAPVGVVHVGIEFSEGIFRYEYVGLGSRDGPGCIRGGVGGGEAGPGVRRLLLVGGGLAEASSAEG